MSGCSIRMSLAHAHFFKVRDASGNVIHDFTFADTWYSAADGGGCSLVVRDENAALATWNTTEGWALSGQAGGTPNGDDGSFSIQFAGWQREHFTPEQLAMPAVSNPLGDANGDGTANIWNYAAGLDPWLPLPAAFQPTAELVGDRLRLRVRVAQNAVDLQVAAGFGSDLVIWNSVLVPLGDPIDEGDGTETLVFEDVQAGGVRRFAREHSPYHCLEFRSWRADSLESRLFGEQTLPRFA